MSVGRAAIVTGLASAVVAVLGLGREMLVSRLFGASPAMDAFVLAVTVVTMGASILGISLRTSLVPVLVGGLGRTERDRVFVASLLGAAAAGALLWVASMAALPWVLRAMLPEISPALANALGQWLSPLWCTGLLAGALQGALQADRQFLGAGLIPGAVPAACMLALGVPLAQGEQADTIALLAGGTLAGATLEVLAAGWLLRRRGWRLRPAARHSDVCTTALRRVAQQSWAMLPGMSAAASSQIIDRAMASALGPGAVSVLNYGGKLPSLALTLGGMAVATAIFPYYAEHLGKNDTAAAQALLRCWARRLLWGGAAAAAVGMAVSLPVARLVFQGGALTAEDAVVVAQVQACALLQLPFCWASWAFSRYLAASGRNGELSLITLGNVVVNVAGNYVCMRWLGVSGIALATAFMFLYALLACRHAVLRRR
ncbi:murein biosynthesis integral membrane protein MurJ [Megalodesulfovibrio gigas]|uniref:Uncharacterized membrane protein, putative virulence factor n=1 Tax=Megalodesulfovibrio gigas (strain ATCC 19364 / DSM 1382 / NCIMB 9332 / VKM B-1759) TaxID=1121448 RepID=T2GAI6_MEGG1|nr:lipid II flippase MurJ [Megalodesulfovibrio gigas]AGW13189.1 putative uncharacterized membrane protein, putative virulence factor [Megalodesulfovibrio gigas DSM 1382 = ATCC 19364]